MESTLRISPLLRANLFVKFIEIKQRFFISVNDSLRFANQLLESYVRRSRPYMHSFHYLVPFLVAHLHTSRTRSRLKFSNISHTTILLQVLSKNKVINSNSTKLIHKNHERNKLLPLLSSMRSV